MHNDGQPGDLQVPWWTVKHWKHSVAITTLINQLNDTTIILCHKKHLFYPQLVWNTPATTSYWASETSGNMSLVSLLIYLSQKNFVEVDSVYSLHLSEIGCCQHSNFIETLKIKGSCRYIVAVNLHDNDIYP